MLPEGFHDRLPPVAGAASRLERTVLDVAHAHGYEQVDPPLAEFEESFAARLKSGSARDAVRFVDPVSQRTLAIRPDMTAQIGRIAATRMGHHPRPVRLCYAGAVVKLRASELQPERALRQIGAELIGLDSVAAAREIVTVAVEALQAAGVSGIAIDFTLPDLVDTLAGGALGGNDLAQLRDRLDAKDAAGVAAIDPAYLPLIEAAGPFERASEKLRAVAGDSMTSRLDGLAEIAGVLGGDIAVTLDPTERHGFEYQRWFGFSLFLAGGRVPIGRGGAYTILRGDGGEEPAVGFSLYADAILALGAGQDGRRRLFLPLDSDPERGAALRREGWVTVQALDAEDTPGAQLCTHVLTDGDPRPL
nr:ATP phosphoribosyltransferase regulatory subunit [Stakelama flava]